MSFSVFSHQDPVNELSLSHFLRIMINYAMVAEHTDKVNCIKEQLLEGKNVKIDDLAIFSIGIKNKKGGATSEDEFNVSKNISNVKLRARATGTLSVKALNLEATLKKATALTGKETTGAGGESGESETPTPTPSTGGGGDNPGDGD